MRARVHRPRPQGRRLASLVAAASVAGSLVAAPAATATAHRPGDAPTVAPRYAHVIEVVMENLSYGAAVTLPGYRRLAASYASLSQSYAASHPSLPNYLDLTGGSTFGISSDCTSCYVRADNLGAQLEARGIRWDDFSQGVPGPCFLGPYAGLYAGKHNPFRYYLDVRDSRRLCAHLLGLDVLEHELRGRASAVPAFSFVTPDVCDDGHSCPASVGLAWLAGFVREVTASRAWHDGGLLVVTWDESYDSDTEAVAPDGRVSPTGGGGHVPTLVVAPGVPAGTVLAEPLSHAGLLATIEANFALRYLRGARAWARHLLRLPGR